LNQGFEREVIERLARIEQEIKPIGGLVTTVNTVNTAVEVVKKDIVDHERRIANIEGWGKWLATAVGILIISQIWQAFVA